MQVNKLEVWLDALHCGDAVLVGYLSNDHGQLRFEYEKNWLRHFARFAIDPDLPLGPGVYFPKKQLGNFGCFLDGSPDRWGQMLMKRRETLEAKDQGRQPHNLYHWDFMVGVQDCTRQGALRLKVAESKEFVSNHLLSAPPLAQLAELEAVARELTNQRLDDLDALRRWLAVLVAPGASLGGARPKANFTQPDGGLWIAKFPSREDQYDVGGWEWVIHALAIKAKINVPEAKALRFGKNFHTFCVKRFDRQEGRRIYYASAMTLLCVQESEGHSYIELAQILLTRGDPATLRIDLEELFRRVIFNLCVSNRDDHLRNHGFIYDGKNWKLSPAFDINPNVDHPTHVLNLNATSNIPDLKTVMESASFYDLTQVRAQQICDEVLTAVSTWKQEAKLLGMGAVEILLMEPAFTTHH